MPLSVLLDRAEAGLLYRVISGILVFQLLLIGAFRVCSYSAPLFALLYTVFLSLSHVMNSLFSKLYIDLTEQGLHIDFGLSRGLGSLAYAGCSFFVSYLLSRQPDLFIHSVTAVIYIGLLFVILGLRALSRRLPGRPVAAPVPVEKHSPPRLRGFLRNYRPFLFLVLGISLVTASNRTFTTFLVVLVEELGGSLRSFTKITGFLALIEIPVMLFFSRFRKRHTISTLLVFSLLLYAVKLGGAAAARSLPVLFVAVTAQTFASGLFHPASVELVRETIPHRDAAKCHALLSGVPEYVAFLFISGFGRLLDIAPARVICFSLFLIALAGTLISRMASPKIKPAHIENPSD